MTHEERKALKLEVDRRLRERLGLREALGWREQCAAFATHSSDRCSFRARPGRRFCYRHLKLGDRVTVA